MGRRLIQGTEAEDQFLKLGVRMMGEDARWILQTGTAKVLTKCLFDDDENESCVREMIPSCVPDSLL